jgi:uncharacterized Zn finger protein
MPRKRKNAGWKDAWSSESWYTPTPPRRVADGIKATTTRGAFGATWWAKRWIAVLGEFGWGSRLQRGRTYARQGQVMAMEITAGLVQAKVQGSRSTPYAVTIRMPVLTDTQWSSVVTRMAHEASVAAQLLSGDMPHDIEQAFDHVAVPLFPKAARDLQTACSCPDVANPCKHIAAVYYLLGERFDADPWMIFTLRGRSKDQLIAALREMRSASLASERDHQPSAIDSGPALHDVLDAFYAAGPEVSTIQPAFVRPVGYPLLVRYGPPPADTEQDLRRIYDLMTEHVFNDVFGTEEERASRED